MLTKFQYVVEQIPGYHVAPSAKPGNFCHVYPKVEISMKNHYSLEL